MRSLARQPQSLARQPQNLAQQELWRQQELWHQQKPLLRPRGFATRAEKRFLLVP